MPLKISDCGNMLGIGMNVELFDYHKPMYLVFYITQRKIMVRSDSPIKIILQFCFGFFHCLKASYHPQSVPARAFETQCGVSNLPEERSDHSPSTSERTM